MKNMDPVPVSDDLAKFMENTAKAIIETTDNMEDVLGRPLTDMERDYVMQSLTYSVLQYIESRVKTRYGLKMD